jgi:hypothetical protein
MRSRLGCDRAGGSSAVASIRTRPTTLTTSRTTKRTWPSVDGRPGAAPDPVPTAGERLVRPAVDVDGRARCPRQTKWLADHRQHARAALRGRAGAKLTRPLIWRYPTLLRRARQSRSMAELSQWPPSQDILADYRPYQDRRESDPGCYRSTNRAHLGGGLSAAPPGRGRRRRPPWTEGR